MGDGRKGRLPRGPPATRAPGTKRNRRDECSPHCPQRLSRARLTTPSPHVHVCVSSYGPMIMKRVCENAGHTGVVVTKSKHHIRAVRIPYTGLGGGETHAFDDGKLRKTPFWCQRGYRETFCHDQFSSKDRSLSKAGSISSIAFRVTSAAPLPERTHPRSPAPCSGMRRQHAWPPLPTGSTFSGRLRTRAVP